MGEQLRGRSEPEALHSIHHVRDVELSLRRNARCVGVSGVSDVARAHDGWADLPHIPLHGSAAVWCVLHYIILASFLSPQNTTHGGHGLHLTDGDDLVATICCRENEGLFTGCMTCDQLSGIIEERSKIDRLKGEGAGKKIGATLGRIACT